MGFGDLSRINTNIQAMQSLTNLQSVNSRLSTHQLRLSTGMRINKAEDDSAGYSIAKKMEARIRGSNMALANIGDAKSMLTVAEGSFTTVMEILQTMKEKAVQAANATLGASERTSIENQLVALYSEVDDIFDGTSFNGQTLFSAGTKTFTFQVGAASGDTFTLSLASTVASTLVVTAAASLGVSTVASAGQVLQDIDDAINGVNTRLALLGDTQKRLTFKAENLSIGVTNLESAKSRIIDADFAKEQLQVVRNQILQQTATTALAQANSAPQSILSLLGN